MVIKKLALVTAMLAATSGAFAMEAMDEEALAATTGQDGITISLATSAKVDVIIHDKDGFAAPTPARPDSGAIVLRGIALGTGVDGTTGAVTGDALVKIDVDAGSTAATATDATLNIGITLGNTATSTNTVVDLGSLRVANSNRTAAGVGWGLVASSESAELLDLGQLTIGAGATMNIQLGNEPQGHLIVLKAVLNGGLTLSNVALNDVGGTLTGGSIGVGALGITDNGGLDLTTNIGVDATTNGLVVSVTQLGNATTGVNMTMANVKIGGATAASIGDVEIIGLNMNGDTITIRGH